MKGPVNRIRSSERDYGAGATSPAFLSPRLWDEDGAFLPPSTEVPHRPTLGSRRQQSDKTCFGLYVFVMVLFVIQGISAVLSANYQLPHEFQMCEDRLRQESVQVARKIPAAEIHQHNLVGDEEQAKRHSKLVDVNGHAVATGSSGGVRHHVAPPAERVAAAVGHVGRGGHDRRLLAGTRTEPEVAEGSMLLKDGLQELLKDLKQKHVHGGGSSKLIKLSSNETENEEGAAAAAPAEKKDAVKEDEGDEKGSASTDSDGRPASKDEAESEEDRSGKTEEEDGDKADADDDGADGELSEAEERTLREMMRRLRGASGIVALMAVSCIVFGLIWVLLLAYFTEPLVYVTLASLPFAFLSGAVVLLAQGWGHAWLVALLLVMSVLSVGVFLYVKPSLPLTVSLLHCASAALLENSSAFGITVFLSVVQVLWLGCCVLFVVLEFMSGVAVRVYPPPLLDGSLPPPRCEWATDGWAYVGMGFILAIMLWTNAIMEEIKRFAIAGGISLWFSSDVKGSFRVVAPDYPSLQALQWALSSSFGSLCFSALVSNLCHALKFCFKLRGEEPAAAAAEREAEGGGGEEEGTPWSLGEVVGFVNRFATPMMGHSGYPFCHSCKVTSLLMGRNNLSEIVDDTSSFVILRIGALVAASWCAAAGWMLSDAYVEWAVVDEGQLQVVHGIVARFVPSSTFGIALLVLNFFASMLLDAMDALLLLYAMDRDNRTMQPRGATLHELLAAQQVGRAQPGISNYTPRGWNYIRQSLSARRSRPPASVLAGQGSSKTLTNQSSGAPSPVKEESPTADDSLSP